jgi:hypothetical protein
MSQYLIKKYLNQYDFHIYNFNEIKNLPNFEYDFTNNTLSIYDIVVKLYKPCFKKEIDNNIIYNSIFNNNNFENHIYFLTDGKKIIIYGFLWSDHNSYRIETVCKNLILNYEKLCFRLLFNLLIKFRKKFLIKPITLEVDKNNTSAIECYQQLGFTGPIVNGIETIKYSNRGYLIIELKFGNTNKIPASLLYPVVFKEIEIEDKTITIKNIKDINGNIKYYYNVKNSL